MDQDKLYSLQDKGVRAANHMLIHAAAFSTPAVHNTSQSADQSRKFLTLAGA